MLPCNLAESWKVHSFTGLKDLHQFYVNTWFPHTLPSLLTSFPLHFIVSLFLCPSFTFSSFPRLHPSLPYPLHLSLVPRPLLFYLFALWFAFSMTYGRGRAAKRFRCSSASIIILNTKLKNKKQGRPGNEATSPFTLPTFIHPMPSLSTSPPALLDNEVTAVSTIWRAQPDNKTVSDRRSSCTQDQDPRPFERRS